MTAFLIGVFLIGAVLVVVGLVAQYVTAVESRPDMAEAPLDDRIGGDGAVTPECPPGARLIPLTQGQYALVDEGVYTWLSQFKWSASISGYKGVSWDARRRKWRAQCHDASGTNRHLGRFVDKIGAARAYDAAAWEWHGDFAQLNFPHEIEDDAR